MGKYGTISDTQGMLTAWWCNNHLEKYEEFVNGVGMTSHRWNGKNKHV